MIDISPSKLPSLKEKFIQAADDVGDIIFSIKKINIYDKIINLWLFKRKNKTPKMQPTKKLKEPLIPKIKDFVFNALEDKQIRRYLGMNIIITIILVIAIILLMVITLAAAILIKLVGIELAVGLSIAGLLPVIAGIALLIAKKED